MAKEVVVITVHGMGQTVPEYYLGLQRKLRKAVGAAIWDERVHLEAVFYQDLLQGNQQDVWDEMDDEHDLRWDSLREFMLFSFSDAAAIEHSLQTGLGLYMAVHRRIRDAFDSSFAACGDAAKPVIMIAQSLGTEQASNYIWDARKGKRLFEATPTTPLHHFRRLETCKHLVTTGCNIPVFKAGLDSPEIFPRPNDDFEWHNYFDKDDVLGYPMRPLSSSFKVDWLHDQAIAVGGFFSGWNPMSHTKYWTDKDFVQPVKDLIVDLL